MMFAQEFTNLVITLFKGDENGGRTHTVTVTDEHDSNTLDRVLTRAVDTGWDIPSVVVTSFEHMTDELVSGIHHATPEAVADLLDCLSRNLYEWDSVIAYVNAYGIDNFDSDEWEDRRWGNGFDSEADFARNYWDEMRPDVVEPDHNSPFSSVYTRHTGELKSMELPEWLVIDWDATAEELDSQGFDYEHYNGQVFVFSE